MNLKSNIDLSYKKLEEFAGIFFIILSGFITAAIFKLSNFLTFPNFDEMLWYFRSRFFWDKMLNFDFSGLIQSAQPGITVYWFTGFMMKFIDFDFGNIARLISEKASQGIDFSFINDNDLALYESYETISFAFNFPMILLSVVFFVTFYYFLKKLGFNRIIAAFSLLFLVTSVNLVYWTTPSDKMLNIFLTLSFLSILIYVCDRNRKYLILSAVFGSWAVLSKLSALFILPFYLFIFVFYYWPVDKKKVTAIAKDYLLWILIFIFVSMVFLPSIITNPREIYDLFFKSKFISGKSDNMVVDHEKFLFYFAYYIQMFAMVAYVAQVEAISLFSYFVLKSEKKHENLFDTLPKKHIKTMSIYILFFMIAVFFTSQIRDIRYMSPALTMLSVISATGLHVLVKVFEKKLKIISYKFFYPATIIFVIIYQLVFFAWSGLFSGPN